MNKRLVIFGIGALIIGLVYLNNRTVPDRHVFAGTTTSAGSGSAEQASPAASATPTPTPATAPLTTPAATPQSSDRPPARHERGADRSRRDDDAVKVDATPAATPYPSVNPAPIDPPSPSPYYRSCGGCGPWQGPGPRPLIMCPLACVNGSE